MLLSEMCRPVSLALSLSSPRYRAFALRSGSRQQPAWLPGPSRLPGLAKLML